MNITEYLQRHERKDLLRFLTCGSVDDGKSTLIGRLLYDAKLIYEDQLNAIYRDTRTHGTTGTDFDPALLTDGLKAEREQGITIDVAYRYFSTDKRKFIIADTPGHEQYTRNMATGASNCSLAIVLVDARNGVIAQTKRHSFICSLLGIHHLVVAVNKMDLVDWSEQRMGEIQSDYLDFAAKLQVADVQFIPISALKGDNVVERSANMPWYQGTTLMNHLETVNIASDRNFIDLRYPVQYVLRPNLDFRGFCGTVASGVIRRGDEVMALPSGRRSRVKSVLTGDGECEEAFPPQAVTVTLEDEIDVSRGSMLVHVRNVPRVSNRFEAMLVWMHETPLRAGHGYLLKHTANVVPAEVEQVRYRMDVNTMHRQSGRPLELNEIGRVVMELHRPIAFDAYTRNRQTGAFILIDRLTNATVAAGMILERDPNELVPERPAESGPKSHYVHAHPDAVNVRERARRLGQRPATVWLTGLPKSGKTTLAYALERRIFERGGLAHVLDGGNLRQAVSADLGFSADDRAENLRRAAGIARLLNDAGLLAICAFVSPYAENRARARSTVEGAPGAAFLEVHLAAPLETCEQRDTDGLYARARTGEIEFFSGVTAPYEAPEQAELVLPTHELSVAECVDRIMAALDERGILEPGEGAPPVEKAEHDA